MLRITLLLLIATTFFPKNTMATATGDSLNYLTLKDTIFLTIGGFDEKLFTHKMEKKQTLYSLAEFYGLSVEELYLYNPGLKESSVSVGQEIQVPIPNRAIIRYTYTVPGFDPNQHIPVFYRVRKGDTMYRICKDYFKMPFEEILERNKLDDFTLKTGQLLRIGWMNINGIPEEYRQVTGGPLIQRNNALRKIYQSEIIDKKEKEHQGVAFWQKNSQEDSDFYALHRHAPINSIIAVTNPMKNRTVYVKVIGRIPNTAYGNDVVVVLSPLSAKLLGAKDPRFFVKVKYVR